MSGRISLSDSPEAVCGDMRVSFDDVGLAGAWFGADLVAERVYVAVRTPDWSTLGGALCETGRRSSEHGVTVDLAAHHQSPSVDFAWTGTIEVSATQVVVTVSGTFGRPSVCAKVGLNVHHSTELSRGRPCAARRHGDARRYDLPDSIGAGGTWRELFPAFETLIIEHDFGGVEYAFEGDLFEMQDHRNWSDDNLKTYGTPLEAGFPISYAVGERLTQRLTITPTYSSPPRERAGDARQRRVVADPKPVARFTLPSLGTDMPDVSVPAGILDSLRDLQLGHARVELDLSEDWDPPTVRTRLELAASIASKTVLAVRCPAESEEVSRLGDLVPSLPEGTTVHIGTAGPGLHELSGLVDQVEKIFQGTGVVVAAAGSFDSFAEMHTARPSWPGDLGVTFPISPTFHVFDDRSVMRNVRPQAEMVDTMRALAGSSHPIHVGPIALIPSRGPFARGPAEVDPHPEVDPRQHQPFTAAWFLGSLASLGPSGCSALTYFDSHGPRGVLTADGTATPLSEVWRLIAGGQDGTVSVARDPAVPTVVVLELVSAGRPVSLVADLGLEPAVVRLRSRGPAPPKLVPGGSGELDQRPGDTSTVTVAACAVTAVIWPPGKDQAHA